MVTLDQAGLNRAALVLLPAPASLRDVVEFLWVDERPSLALNHSQWRVVADDAPHLIYYRYTDRHARTDRHRLNVVGARARFVDVDCSQRLFTVGARLRPGMVPSLFRIPARELTNRSVSAHDIAGTPARDALSQLGDETSLGTVRHLTTFIHGVVARARPLDERTRWLTGADWRAPGSVGDIAHTLGIGDRALRGWSTTHLGLGLRRFLSIRRLHHALRLRLEQPSVTWSRIAAAAGFADQPHLVRDCRALLGESPGEFFARAS